MKIVFDGQVYAQRITGQYRYADELLKAFDRIAEKDKYEIIIPEYVETIPKFENIKVVKYGKVKGILWTQTSLVKYLIKNKALVVGFCNTTPIIKPGITTIHDIGYKTQRKFYNSFYGKVSCLWHSLNYWIVAKSDRPIITVSNFSKNEMSSVYGIDKNRIKVIENAWQQYESIEQNDDIFEREKIEKKKYFFSLGSLEGRKNYKWVVEVAKNNPDKMFVVAGGFASSAKNMPELQNKNIKYVGYISDGEAKALMSNAIAFLFPSFYEGFGIPPLEALSVGTPVICSNAASIPEICGDAVRYVSPLDYDVDLSIKQSVEIEKVKTVLERYSWEVSAEKLYEFLEHEKM